MRQLLAKFQIPTSVLAAVYVLAVLATHVLGEGLDLHEVSSLVLAGLAGALGIKRPSDMSRRELEAQAALATLDAVRAAQDRRVKPDEIPELGEQVDPDKREKAPSSDEAGF